MKGKTAFKWITTVKDYPSEEAAKEDIVRLRSKTAILVRSEGWFGHDGANPYTVEYSQPYKNYEPGF